VPPSPVRGNGPRIGSGAEVDAALAKRLEAVASHLEGQVQRLATLPLVSNAAEFGMLRAGLAGLQDIDELISRTRVEVAGLSPEAEAASRLAVASDELEGVVNSTEQAAVQIMAAAEKSQDAAGRIRAVPGLPDAALHELDAIDEASTDTFMACSFQDLTGQRIRKVVQALTYVEGRVKSLIELWSHVALPAEPPPPPRDGRPDAHLLHGPSDDGLVQDDVDSLFGAPALATTVASQSDIDSLFN
jgi:chemotaxis protein CheZ